MLITRRSLLGIIAAPAVIRVADLMPIKAITSSYTFRIDHDGGPRRHYAVVSYGADAPLTIIDLDVRPGGIVLDLSPRR